MKNKFVTKVTAMTLAFVLAGSMAVTGPVQTLAAAKRVTVKTQKQLEKALKNKNVKNIVIKTPKALSFKIKDADFNGKTLTVNAPNASVENMGDFKKILVKDGKKFVDRGEKNKISVQDPNELALLIGKQATDTTVSITSKKGNITVGGAGALDQLRIDGNADITVKGRFAKELDVFVNKEDANVSIESTANVIVHASANINVSKGAAVGRLEIGAGVGSIDLKVDGTIETVDVNSKATVHISGDTEGTLKINNHAAGASIRSEVKLEVRLNADASLFLQKGAEGSAIKLEQEGVKATVDNKTTTAVSVTDATGNNASVDAGKTTTVNTGKSDAGNKDQGTTGGSSGSTTGGSSSGTTGGSSSGTTGGSSGGTTESNSLVVTLKHEKKGEAHNGVRKGDVLTAAVTGAPKDAKISYQWFRSGNVIVSAADQMYTVQAPDQGEKLSVKVTAEIDKKRYEQTAATADVVECEGRIEVPGVTGDYEYFADYGTSADELIRLLAKEWPTVDFTNGKDTVQADITWMKPDDYWASPDAIVHQEFYGSVTPPKGWYFEESTDKKVLCKVTVYLKNSLAFTVEEAQDAGFKSATDVFDVTQSGRRAFITGYYTDWDGSTRYPVDVTVSGTAIDINNLMYQIGYGGTLEKLPATGKIRKNGDKVRIELNAEELKYSGNVTYYFRMGDDNRTATSLTFVADYAKKKLVNVNDYLKEYEVPYGTKYGDLGLPQHLRFTDNTGKATRDFRVAWVSKPLYNETKAGTYEFTANIDPTSGIGDYDITCEIPSIRVTVEEEGKTPQSKGSARG